MKHKTQKVSQKKKRQTKKMAFPFASDSALVIAVDPMSYMLSTMPAYGTRRREGLGWSTTSKW